MTGRVDLLRESLEEPLLVTNGVNVGYLVGFSSSNAALLVEPERLRLFSDFRYAEAARAVEGVEFVETRRSLVAALPEQLEGRIGFEADAVSYASWETLSSGGLELVWQRSGGEGARAVGAVAVDHRACVDHHRLARFDHAIGWPRVRLCAVRARRDDRLEGGRAGTQFVEELGRRVPKDKVVMFLCRSGGRSHETAALAKRAGYAAFNVLEGFEGDRDPQGHRNSVGGWRAAGLPWSQS